MSEVVQTLDDEIDAPRSADITAHRFGLYWKPPVEDGDESSYKGKVTNYKVFGKLAIVGSKLIYPTRSC